MRAIRQLPLAASVVLVGSALGAGGGAGAGSLPWLGGVALLAILGLLATCGVPQGWPAVVPLFAVTAWLAATIAWSALPARSWEYANRALVYALAATVGLWLAPHTRRFALALLAALGAVVVWALLAKIVPPLYDDYGRAARLRSPVGLWNQLALVGSFALPLALWRRRLEGTLLAYTWLVALALTLSRGGVATALVVVAAWFVLSDERLAAAHTLACAALPAAVVVGVAFALPGITEDGTSSGARWRDGLVFGAVLLAGAVAAALLRRTAVPRDSPRLRRALLAAGVVAAVVVAVVAALNIGSFTESSSLSNGTERFTSAGSNFRTEWWGQAWRAFEDEPLAGTGAGTFKVTNIRERASFLDETTEPHNLPLQFLSETGIVGLALLAVSLALLLRAAGRRREHELALSLLLPALLVHALVDVDWDFAAVSVPAFVAAGALAGGPALRRASPPGVLVAAGAAAFVFGVLVLPWLGARWAEEALVAPAADAPRLANRAEAVDPLLVEPLWAKAFAAHERREFARALAYYGDAVDRQPENPQTWRLAGEYAFSLRCYRSAYEYLVKYTELDPKGRPGSGADDYREALRQVNAGNNRC